MSFYYTDYYPRTIADEIKDKKKYKEQNIKNLLCIMANCLNYVQKTKVMIFYLDPSWIVEHGEYYKLIDFRIGSTYLNLRYAAPEFLNSIKSIRPILACIFSLGLIVLELLDIEISNMNTTELNSILLMKIDSLLISEDLKTVLKKMLHAEKDSRCSLKDLFAYLAIAP